MNLYSEYTSLSSTIKQLTSLKLDSTESSITNELAEVVREHVYTAARELSLERFENFERDFYSLLGSLVLVDDSTGNNSKSTIIGGVIIIRELIDCTSAASELKLLKFSDILSGALKNSTDFKIIDLITNVYGYLAKSSLTSSSHLLSIEKELNIALEILKLSTVNNIHRRYAACSILKQLATNISTVFFIKIKEFFDVIWNPLWDSKESIRVAASQAISNCLEILKFRSYSLEWHCWIYDKVIEGFNKGTNECIHGSILVTSELLTHTGEFMIPRFKEICSNVFEFKENKSKVIKASITNLLPKLAKYCPDAFARFFLNISIDFLIKIWKITELRSEILLSIGKLCFIFGSNLLTRVDEILVLIREALSSSAKSKKSDLSTESLHCISNMIRGFGSSFHEKALGLIDVILTSGLTADLIETLNVIAESVPSQKFIVQNKLLDEIIKILGGDIKPKIMRPNYEYSWSKAGTRQNYISSMKMLESNENGSSTLQVESISAMKSNRPKSTQVKQQVTIAKIPFSFFRTKSSSPSLGVGAASTDLEYKTSEQIVLALKTLATLQPPRYSIISLVQNSILTYLCSNEEVVRKEAAVTCFIDVTSGPSSKVIEKIISTLIEMSITDVSTEVRQVILKSLPISFDIYLSRQSVIQNVVFLLSDENFEIRLQALKILGRLSIINPGVVLPHLRQFLCKKISILKNSTDNKLKEEAALLVCNFMRAMALQPVVKAYLGTLIRSLPLSETKIEDTKLVTASLEAVGEICLVMREDTLPYADHLLNLVIKNMRDSTSSKKQEIAIRTLGQLVSATGQVVRPYMQYPQLLPWALDMLFQNSSKTTWSLRSEVLRTIGLIGALEPRKYNIILSHLNALNKIRSEQREKESIEKETFRHRERNSYISSTLKGQLFAPAVGVKDRSDSITISTTSNSQIIIPDDSLRFNSTKDKISVDELIFSEVLLDEENVDSPSYFFMYEQSAMKSLSEPFFGEIPRLLPNSEEYYPQALVVLFTWIK
eukprot:gene18854-24639_t